MSKLASISLLFFLLTFLSPSCLTPQVRFAGIPTGALTSLGVGKK